MTSPNRDIPPRLEWSDLDVEPHDGIVIGPTRDDVEAIVMHLEHCTEGFIILSRGDMTYVQAAFRDAGDADSGLIVEHQDGSLDRHDTLDEEFISPSRANVIFQRFMADPQSVRTGSTWKPMDL